jgi:hypothetical protein
MVRQLAVKESKRRTFVSNIELLLDPDRPVVGVGAKKIGQVSPRAIWYEGYDTIVLPAMPDPDFVKYVADFGQTPAILVPKGLRTNSLSILHGRDDIAFQNVVTECEVESYITNDELGDFVRLHNGVYLNNSDTEAVSDANNKGLYRQFAEGIIDVPEGTLERGIDAIALAVQERLQKSGTAFVRHVHSGGGFGNRSFAVVGGIVPSLNEIKQKLAGDHAERWSDGQALVETYLDLLHSPAVTFTIQDGFKFDNLQITRNSDYRGCWSPTPPGVYDPKELVNIGNRFAHKLKKIGYKGYGNTDLGVDATGRGYGFEINARMTGARHAIAIGERTMGPWEEWRDNGSVVKSIDHFVLRHATSFRDLRHAIGKQLMATLENPYGVIIIIPPHDNVVGLQIQAKGYKEAESIYQQVLAKVGHSTANQHDSPLAV